MWDSVKCFGEISIARARKAVGEMKNKITDLTVAPSSSQATVMSYSLVVMQFFLLIYCIVSAKKNKLTSLFAAFNTRKSTKTVTQCIL